MTLLRITLLSVSVLAALCASPTEVQLSPEVTAYTISLIQHLVQHNYGIFDCWFYDSPRSVLDPVVSSKELHLIPKILLLNAGTVPVLRQPAIAVVFCDQVLKAEFLASDFNHYMKIIVIYGASLSKAVVELFKSVFLYNVVYIRSDRLEVQSELVFGKEQVNYLGFVPFEEVFVDQTRDVGGYRFEVSTFHYQHYVGPRKMKNYNEVVFIWVGEAVTRMNGTVQYHTFNCDTVEKCTTKSFMFNTTKMYDFCLDGYSLEAMMKPFFLESVMPNMIGIVVPRGRKLTSFEIFVAPFTLEAWISLILLIAGCVVLKAFNFQLFQNDLILFALCGFERRNLYKVSKAEKVVITALVFLFFIITSAYESKMTSLMTSIPRVRDPQSLDDLIQLNITVKDLNLKDTVFRSYDDPRLRQIFRGDPKHLSRGNEWDIQDQTRAYFGSLGVMRMKMHHSLTYDEKAGRSRYIILDQLSAFTIVFRPIHFRSPFRAKFRWTERAFFEAGLLEMLPQKFTRLILGVTQDNIVKAKQDAVGKDVGIAELLPAWQVLAIGWGISMLTLSFELFQRCWHKITKIETYHPK